MPGHDDGGKVEGAPAPPAAPQSSAAPADPAATGAAPVDPGTAGTAPVDPAATGAAPVDPATAGTAPVDPAAAGAAPVDPATAGTALADPVTAGIAPVDPATAGAAPAATAGTDNDIIENEAPRPLKPPGEATYDPEPARDEARKWLAFMLVWLLCGIIAASFLLLWILGKDNWGSLKALLELILAPVVALVGSATGFYFGGGGKTGKS